MDRVDWVTKCALCTAQEVFKCLVDEFRHDIQKVNALDLPRFRNGRFELELTSNDSCKIHWIRNTDAGEKSGPAIIIRCENDLYINVVSVATNVCDSEIKILNIGVRWDTSSSRGMLTHSKDTTELQPWEISQQALHHLFFVAFLD